MFRFKGKGIHSFLNDVDYQSLEEVPIDGYIRHQLNEDIVVPRRANENNYF